MTYNLAANRQIDLEQFKFQSIIADEAHYLKSRDAKRTKTLLPILQSARRVILLTGTPVLARPVEIYNLLKVIRPDVCPTFKEFTDRYCAPKLTRYGIDYSGSACPLELHFLLQNIMIRRLKKDVLDELPDKRRTQIEI